MAENSVDQKDTDMPSLGPAGSEPGHNDRKAVESLLLKMRKLEAQNGQLRFDVKTSTIGNEQLNRFIRLFVEAGAPRELHVDQQAKWICVRIAELRAELAAPAPVDHLVGVSADLLKALKGIIEQDDDAKAAAGIAGATLNGVGLVDLFDHVGHPFGAGQHKQMPLPSNNLEAALIDARAAIASAETASSTQLEAKLYNVNLLRDSLRRDLDTAKQRGETLESAVRAIADAERLTATEMRAIARDALRPKFPPPPSRVEGNPSSTPIDGVTHDAFPSVGPVPTNTEGTTP